MGDDYRTHAEMIAIMLGAIRSIRPDVETKVVGPGRAEVIFGERRFKVRVTEVIPGDPARIIRGAIDSIGQLREIEDTSPDELAVWRANLQVVAINLQKAYDLVSK